MNKEWNYNDNFFIKILYDTNLTFYLMLQIHIDTLIENALFITAAPSHEK